MDENLYQEILEYLKENKIPENKSQKENQKLITRAKYFKEINGQLFKKHRQEKGKLLRVIQRHELEQLLYMMHNHPTARHMGIDATYKRVKERYYWNQMYDDIKKYVQTCNACQRFGKPQRNESLHSIEVGKPFERVGIDIVGPLPKTTRGNKYIVVAIDYLTKWPEAKALSNATAENVADFIYEDIICRHGTPQILLTDQGTHFKNKLVTELCEKFKVKHKLSSPYHPQTNGLVERFNRTLTNALGKMQDTMNWNEYISSILFAYRTSEHSTTKYTPFFLNYGREAILPIENEPLKDIGNYDLEETILQRAFILNELLPQYHDKARELIKQSQKKSEQRHKVKMKKEIQYTKGDLVLLYDSKLDKQWSGKLDTKWKGPFEVHERLSQGSYILKNKFGQPLKEIIHSDRLKKYEDRTNWIPQIVI